MTPMWNVKVKVATWQNSKTGYGLLSLAVSIGVHQEAAKPSNFVAFLMGFLNWQEMLALALVFTSAAGHWTFLMIYFVKYEETELHGSTFGWGWAADEPMPRMSNSPDLLRTILAWALKVLQPRICHGLRQTRMVSHPTCLYTEGHPQ